MVMVMDTLRGVAVLDFIQQDERPIFIIDLETNPPSLVLFNTYLEGRNCHPLKHAIQEQFHQTEAQPSLDSSSSSLKAWCSLPSGEADGLANAHWFQETRWVAYVVQNRFRIVSGDREGAAVALPPALHTTNQITNERYIPQCLQFLWNDDTTAGYLTEFLKLFHEFDWASTLLGPKHQWSFQLLHACELLLSDPRPSSLMWGPDRVFIYNEKYAEVLGSERHPKSLGSPLTDVWPEIYQAFDPFFEEILRTGAGFTTQDTEYVLGRHGYPEETFFSLGLIPISGDSGEPAFLNPVYDTTKQVVAERRLSTLLALTPPSTFGLRLEDAWEHIISTLKHHTKDLPLVIVYSNAESLDVESTAPASEWSSGKSVSEDSATITSYHPLSWNLEGTIGFPDGSSNLPSHVTTEAARELTPVFTAALGSTNPSTLSFKDGTLTKTLFADISGSSLKEQCENGIFIPLRSISGERVLGFMIIGINPRIPYTIDYQHFIQVFQQQLSTILGSAYSLEINLERTTVAADRAIQKERRLNERLVLTMKESSNMMEKFERYWRLAEMSTVGMFDFSPEGDLIQANETWYLLSGHPLVEDNPRRFSFLDCVYEPDVPLVQQQWAILLTGSPSTFEMRWKRNSQTIDANHPEWNYLWVLSAWVPVHDAEGKLISISGCTTDISSQKWAENSQRMRTEEAIENKRQQENFIDMTSHEMRNPLSAMFQCADSIVFALTEVLKSPSVKGTLRGLIDEGLESAQTIVTCAKHQKRIIDDVLTLSKLDSKLLAIAPVDVKPEVFLQDLRKMFDVEARRANIHFETISDKTMDELKVRGLRLDPSRTHQVLVNLVTNAMKFTKTETRRVVTVSMGASLQPPECSIFGDPPVAYYPSQTLYEDVFTREGDWGEGEVIYLHFSIRDTGRGITPEEREKLFTRFSQASSRTHVQYGGSGLGLFVSRELVELQGGGIGICSEYGVGSTFAFYVKTKRALVQTARKASTDSEIPRSTTKMSVLVVEDNIVNNKILCRQLAKLGYDVSGVGNGQEALDYLKETNFWHELGDSGKHVDVVLMDIEMPIMDGLTCTTEIRALQREGLFVRHVPIIAVSANARTEQIADSIAAGTDDSMPKPFRIAELVPKMENLLRHFSADNPPTSR